MDSSWTLRDPKLIRLGQKKGGFDSNLGRISTSDGNFLTIKAVQTCAEEACNNLGDLASNLG